MDRRDFVRTGATLGAAALAAPLLEGCRFESRRELADGGFIQLRDGYFRDQLVRNPVTSTYLGGDGWDPALQSLGGRLRDFSAAALADENREYKKLERSHSSIDAALLTPQRRVDHAVMGAQIAFLRYQLDRRYHERCVDTYAAEPFRRVDWQIQQMHAFPDGPLGVVGGRHLLVARLDS